MTWSVCGSFRKFRGLFASHTDRVANQAILCSGVCECDCVLVGKFACQFSEARDFCQCSNRLVLSEAYSTERRILRRRTREQEQSIVKRVSLFPVGRFSFAKRGPHLCTQDLRPPFIRYPPSRRLLSFVRIRKFSDLEYYSTIVCWSIVSAKGVKTSGELIC